MAQAHIISPSSSLARGLPRTSCLGSWDMKTTLGLGEGCRGWHFKASLQAAGLFSHGVKSSTLSSIFCPSYCCGLRGLFIVVKPRERCTNCSCPDCPGFLCLCCFCGGSDFATGRAEVAPYREPHPDSDLSHVCIALKTSPFFSLYHELWNYEAHPFLDHQTCAQLLITDSIHGAVIENGALIILLCNLQE